MPEWVFDEIHLMGARLRPVVSYSFPQRVPDVWSERIDLDVGDTFASQLVDFVLRRPGAVCRVACGELRGPKGCRWRMVRMISAGYELTHLCTHET